VHTRQIGPSFLHFSLRCGRQNSPPQTRHFPPSTGRNGLRHAAHVNDRLTTRSLHSRATATRYCGRKKRRTSKRELIDTVREQDVRKAEPARIVKDMDDVGRSLTAERASRSFEPLREEDNGMFCPTLATARAQVTTIAVVGHAGAGGALASRNQNRPSITGNPEDVPQKWRRGHVCGARSGDVGQRSQGESTGAALDVGGRIHSGFRSSASDTFALVRLLGVKSGAGIPRFPALRCHPLPPVTFPGAPRVLMKQVGRSHEAKQTTDRRRAA
jgi:hypothetical protein